MKFEDIIYHQWEKKTPNPTPEQFCHMWARKLVVDNGSKLLFPWLRMGVKTATVREGDLSVKTVVNVSATDSFNERLVWLWAISGNDSETRANQAWTAFLLQPKGEQQNQLIQRIQDSARSVLNNNRWYAQDFEMPIFIERVEQFCDDYRELYSVELAEKLDELQKGWFKGLFELKTRTYQSPTMFSNTGAFQNQKRSPWLGVRDENILRSWLEDATLIEKTLKELDQLRNRDELFGSFASSPIYDQSKKVGGLLDPLLLWNNSIWESNDERLLKEAKSLKKTFEAEAKKTFPNLSEQEVTVLQNRVLTIAKEVEKKWLEEKGFWSNLQRLKDNNKTITPLGITIESGDSHEVANSSNPDWVDLAALLDCEPNVLSLQDATEQRYGVKAGEELLTSPITSKQLRSLLEKGQKAKGEERKEFRKMTQWLLKLTHLKEFEELEKNDQAAILDYVPKCWSLFSKNSVGLTGFKTVYSSLTEEVLEQEVSTKKQALLLKSLVKDKRNNLEQEQRNFIRSYITGKQKPVSSALVALDDFIESVIGGNKNTVSSLLSPRGHWGGLYHLNAVSIDLLEACGIYQETENSKKNTKIIDGDILFGSVIMTKKKDNGDKKIGQLKVNNNDSQGLGVWLRDTLDGKIKEENLSIDEKSKIFEDSVKKKKYAVKKDYGSGLLEMAKQFRNYASTSELQHQANAGIPIALRAESWSEKQRIALRQVDEREPAQALSVSLLSWLRNIKNLPEFETPNDMVRVVKEALRDDLGVSDTVWRKMLRSDDEQTSNLIKEIASWGQEGQTQYFSNKKEAMETLQAIFKKEVDASETFAGLKLQWMGWAVKYNWPSHTINVIQRPDGKITKIGELLLPAIKEQKLNTVEGVENFLQEIEAKQVRRESLAKAFVGRYKTHIERVAGKGQEPTPAQITTIQTAFTQEASLVIDWFQNVEFGVWQAMPQELSWRYMWDQQERWHHEVAATAKETNKGVRQWFCPLKSPWVRSGYIVKGLTSGKDLGVEGADMKHCVSSYSGYCSGGQMRLFNISFDGDKVATLELRPRFLEAGVGKKEANLQTLTADDEFVFEVTQNRGKHNSAVSEKIREIANQFALDYTQYYKKELIRIREEEKQKREEKKKAIDVKFTP